MTLAELRKILNADAKRYHPISGGAIHRMLIDPFFNVLFWFRILTFLQSRGGISRLVSKLIGIGYAWQSQIIGIYLPIGTEISSGFALLHATGSVINRTVQIGSNVTILQGVTIGSKRPITTVFPQLEIM